MMNVGILIFEDLVFCFVYWVDGLVSVYVQDIEGWVWDQFFNGGSQVFCGWYFGLLRVGRVIFLVVIVCDVGKRLVNGFVVGIEIVMWYYDVCMMG